MGIKEFDISGTNLLLSSFGGGVGGGGGGGFWVACINNV